MDLMGGWMWVNVAEFDKPILVLVKIMITSYRYQPSNLQQSFPLQNDQIGIGSRFLQRGSMATVAGNADTGYAFFIGPGPSTGIH